MAPLRDAAFRLAFEGASRLSQASRVTRRLLGVHRPFALVPYRGFGTTSRARIQARVIERRGVVERQLERGIVGGAVASYVRFDTFEIPGARVRVRWDDDVHDGVTDEAGFVDLVVKPPRGASSGVHTVELEVVAPDEGHPLPRALAEVVLVGDDATHGVVTDVDDTIIDTGVPNLARRAFALFLAEAWARKPFDGVAELYDALATNARGRRANPIVYVSSSPVNLYEHLEHFMEAHGLPAGPILLRDWGLSRDGFAPDGRHHHKIDKIRRVLADVPALPFVLFGDSGQRDPEHYLSVVRAEPGRVPVVYVREVPSRVGRRAELDRLAAEYRESGSELVLFGRSAEALADARARGFAR